MYFQVLHLYIRKRITTWAVDYFTYSFISKCCPRMWLQICKSLLLISNRKIKYIWSFSNNWHQGHFEALPLKNLSLFTHKLYIIFILERWWKIHIIWNIRYVAFKSYLAFMQLKRLLLVIQVEVVKTKYNTRLERWCSCWEPELFFQGTHVQFPELPLWPLPCCNFSLSECKPLLWLP